MDPEPNQISCLRPATWTFVVVCVLVVCCFAAQGCAGLKPKVELPSHDQFDREQLRIFSDFRLPRRHRLLDELTARRRDIADRLLLPMSDEPIKVYLFENEKRFARYLKQNFPLFPNRRAFFVKNDTDLKVYAHWGENVAGDLRHEVTHGYLHSVVPNLPLWLDEGLAEYFELPRGSNGLHRQHIYYLTEMARNEQWTPSLNKLESLTDAAEMSQVQYAESWLWVHYLMESGDEKRKVLQDQLARFRMTGDADPLSHHLSMVTQSKSAKSQSATTENEDTTISADELEEAIIEHLATLVESMVQDEAIASGQSDAS